MGMGMTAVVMGAALALGQVPLGLPPQPQDAQLMQAAPEECFVLFSSAGCVEPSAESDNRAERFLADPDIQACTDHLGRLLRALGEDAVVKLEREGGFEFQMAVGQDGDVELEPVAELAACWIQRLMTQPFMIYVQSPETMEDTAPGDVQAGLILKSDDPAAARGQIDTLIRFIRKVTDEAEVDVEYRPLDRDDAHGAMIRRKTPAAGASDTTSHEVVENIPLECGAAAVGPYLVFSVGEGELESVIERMKTPEPNWLIRAKGLIGVERLSTFAYASGPEWLELARNDVPEGLPVMLGLFDDLDSIVWGSGFHAGEFVSKTQLLFDGELPEALKPLTLQQIERESLALVPKDAVFAAAIALPDKLLTIDEAGNVRSPLLTVAVGQSASEDQPTITLDTGETVPVDFDFDIDSDASEPSAAEALSKKVATEAGRNLIDGLGSQWVAYLSPRENGLIPWNGVVANRLDDPETFRKAHGKLLLILTAQALADADAGQVVISKVGDVTYHTWMKDGATLFSWFMHGDVLYLSRHPHSLKSIVLRDESFIPLDAEARTAGLITAADAPIALARCDVALLFDLLYGLLPELSAPIRQGLAEAGPKAQEVGFPTTFWPAPATIRKHLRPGIVTFSAIDGGLELAVRSTIPCNELGMYISAYIFGAGYMMFPGRIMPAYTGVEKVDYVPPADHDQVSPPYISEESTDEMGGAFAPYAAPTHAPSPITEGAPYGSGYGSYQNGYSPYATGGGRYDDGSELPEAITPEAEEEGLEHAPATSVAPPAPGTRPRPLRRRRLR